MMRRIFALIIAILIIGTFTISVGAAVSPEGTQYITIHVNSSGRGSTTGQPVKIDPENPEPVTLTATENGDTFDHWVIEGEYTIVSGSLTDRVIVIIPGADIDATAVFVDKNGSVETTAPSVKPGNTSDTSPKTGDMSIFVVSALLMAAMVGCLAVKKVKG